MKCLWGENPVIYLAAVTVAVAEAVDVLEAEAEAVDETESEAEEVGDTEGGGEAVGEEEVETVEVTVRERVGEIVGAPCRPLDVR